MNKPPGTPEANVRAGTYERQVNNRRLSGINPGAPAHPFQAGRRPGDPSPVDAATPPVENGNAGSST